MENFSIRIPVQDTGLNWPVTYSTPEEFRGFTKVVAYIGIDKMFSIREHGIQDLSWEFGITIIPKGQRYPLYANSIEVTGKWQNSTYYREVSMEVPPLLDGDYDVTVWARGTKIVGDQIEAHWAKMELIRGG